MNILVINGSPKGNSSITLQTLLFLEKLKAILRIFFYFFFII